MTLRQFSQGTLTEGRLSTVDLLVLTSLDQVLLILQTFTFLQTSYEEVNCTEPSSSVSVPLFGIKTKSFFSVNKFKNTFFKFSFIIKVTDEKVYIFYTFYNRSKLGQNRQKIVFCKHTSLQQLLTQSKQALKAHLHIQFQWLILH